MRKEGLRGQAWVIFDDTMAATAAVQAENGFDFFGKELKVAYALEVSDRIAKRNGTYVPKDRRPNKRMKMANTSTTMMTTTTTTTVADPSSLSINTSTDNTTTTTTNNNMTTTTTTSVVADDDGSNTEDAGIKKEQEDDQQQSQEATDKKPVVEEPSNILFAQDVPTDCNEMMLAMLFRQYPGYKEVRIPRSGLAFVEFKDEPHATVALKALNGFQLTANDKLNLTYGKKNT